MKVLVVGEAPFIPSSFGKITYYIASGLMRRGHKVVVAAPVGVTTLFSKSLMYVPTESCNDPASEKVRGFRDLCRDVARGPAIPVVGWPQNIKAFLENVFGADVILVYGTPYADPLAGFLKHVYESRIDVPVAGYFVSESLIIPKDLGLHAGNATVFASPSRFILRTFIKGLKAWGVSERGVRDRVRVVYHGVDWGIYSPETRDYFRRNHYLLDSIAKAGDFVIGTFAKNHVRKDLGALILAYASLPKELREWVWLLVSAVIGCGGEEHWKLEMLVQAASQYAGVETEELSGRVVDASDHFREGCTEWQVLRIYSSMDLLAFPTLGESFGLPPLEAGLMGVPFIVTAHPVMLELWGNALPEEFFVLGHEWVTGEGLVLYAPDILDLRRALVTAVTNEKLRDKAVENVRVRAEELGLTAEGMVGGIESLLKEAIDIGASPISDMG